MTENADRVSGPRSSHRYTHHYLTSGKISYSSSYINLYTHTQGYINKYKAQYMIVRTDGMASVETLNAPRVTLVLAKGWKV